MFVEELRGVVCLGTLGTAQPNVGVLLLEKKECHNFHLQDISNILPYWLEVVWFQPTDQNDSEPNECFNVDPTITGLDFIGF